MRGRNGIMEHGKEQRLPGLPDLCRRVSAASQQSCWYSQKFGIQQGIFSAAHRLPGLDPRNQYTRIIGIQLNRWVHLLWGGLTQVFKPCLQVRQQRRHMGSKWLLMQRKSIGLDMSSLMLLKREHF